MEEVIQTAAAVEVFVLDLERAVESGFCRLGRLRSHGRLTERRSPSHHQAEREQETQGATGWTTPITYTALRCRRIHGVCS